MTVESNVGQWQECLIDSDYEIFDQFPFPIRRKGSDKIVIESVDDINGYIRCKLNGNNYRKHRIVATQWLPNPDNLPEVDHINHDRTDNRIENLRWVNRSSNMQNRSSYNRVDQEYVDEISDEAIEVTDYNGHDFDFYYFVEEDDSFYFYTGVNYRKLHVNFNKSGNAYVNVRDIDHKKVAIYYNKFKRLYGLI